MKKNVEKAIQVALVLWVKENYPNVKISMSGNENAHYKMGMGVDSGEPDLWLYTLPIAGISYFLRLELKTKVGKLNANQKKWNAWFDNNYEDCPNHVRAVAYGLEEARNIIKLWINRLLAPQNLEYQQTKDIG